MHRLLMVPTVIQILQIQKIALLGISSSRFSIYKTFSMLNNRKLAKTEQYRRILKKLTHMIRSSLLETKSSKKKPINNCVNQLCSNRLSLKGYKASNLNTRPPANKINSSGCNIRRHSNSNSSSSRCSLSSPLCKHLHSWINHLRISNNSKCSKKNPTILFYPLNNYLQKICETNLLCRADYILILYKFADLHSGYRLNFSLKSGSRLRSLLQSK